MLTQTIGGVPRIPRQYIRNTDGIPLVHKPSMYRNLVENGVLREDQAREIDDTLTRVARRDLVVVAMLRRAGMFKQLSGGIGTTQYEFERITPVGEAEQSMSILGLGQRDLVTFAKSAIPVPVTASQFMLDARQRAAGDRGAEGVSLVNVEEHTRAVAEKLEDSVFNGSDVVVGANGMPGFTNFTGRQQFSFSDASWPTASDPGASAVADVLAMRAGLRADGFNGPYALILPANYDEILDADFKANSDRTLRERLLSINGIDEILVSATLADDNVLLVQKTRSVAELAVGQDITTVTWDEYGGLADHWAILAVIGCALKVAAARAPLSSGTLPALTTSSGIAHLA